MPRHYGAFIPVQADVVAGHVPGLASTAISKTHEFPE